jgi:hypothetical protein
MRKRFVLGLSFWLLVPACTPTGDPVQGDSPPGTGGKAGASAGGTGGNVAATGGSSATGGTASGTGTGGTGGQGMSTGTGGSGGQAMPTGSGGTSTPPGTGGDSTGSPDSGTDVPATPPGGCAGAKFCDDFEGQELGKAPSGGFTLKVGSGATLLVDTSKAFSGKQAIAIKGPKGSFGAQLVFGAPQLPLPSNDLHGRMMVFMTAVPGGGVHFDNVLASGTLAAGGSSTYVLGGMYGNFMAVYHPGDCSVDSSTKFPAGRWACIQWEFKGAKDGTHVLKMMMDGMTVDKGEITTKGPNNCAAGNNGGEWKAPTFNRMSVGWVNYQSSPIPVEMWIDDLAFGEAPIPCPPPK